MDKVVILCSGVPGSGKTTIARKLSVAFNIATRSCEIVSADNYPGYYDENNNYIWTAEKAKNAHAYCRNLFTKHLTEGKASVIIVDNTNLTKRTRAFYTDIAKKCNWTTLVLAILPEPSEIDQYVKRNTHKVPMRSIKEMMTAFYNDLGA